MKRVGLILITMSLVAFGCNTTPLSGTTVSRVESVAPTDLNYPGAELDYVARTLDQFGYLSIAGATFIEPDPRFQFNLDLTPRELLERNRIEGSSRESTSRAIDFQLSVQAEMVQNLIGQMSATNDPSLLDSLKQKLQSAAFSSLVDRLPPELTENIDVPRMTSPTSAPAIGSDGGQSYLNLAHAAMSESLSLLAKADELYGEIAPDATVDAPGESQDEASGVLENATNVVQRQAVAMKEGASASVAAQDLLLQIESRLSGAPGGTLGGGLLNFADVATLKTSLRDGKSNAEAIVGAASKRQEDIRSAYDDASAATLKAKAEGTIKKVKEGFTVPSPKTADTPMAPKEVLDALSAAVDKARALAAASGVEITPGQPPQKILVADRIKDGDRNAKKAVGGFTDALDPYTGEVSPNLRQVLLNSASDHMTQEMLRWLSYPSGFGPGKRVYLTMATVSCIPGRDTYQNFMGHVSAEISYGKSKENGDVEKASNSPLVFSLYPFLDTQFLDLRSSQRRALTMAFQLVLNGYPAAANAFLDYAKRDELDVHTVTGINSVVGSVTGSNVGFTFSPRLTALNDPSKLRGRPGMLLQPQSFPALVMIVCDEGDLIVNDPTGNDHVVWKQSYRWTAAPKPTVDRFGFPGRLGDQLWHLRPRLSETKMGKMANDLDRASEVLENWEERNSGSISYESGLLDKRINHLHDFGLGSDVYMGLPLINDETYCASEVPKDLSVEPKTVWIDSKTDLFISSASQEPLNGTYDVTVGGFPVNAVKISPHTLRAKVPPFAETGNFGPAEGTEVPVVVASHFGAVSAGAVKLAYLLKEAPVQMDDTAECGKRIANGYVTADGGAITVVLDKGHDSRIKARMSHRLVQGSKPITLTTLVLKGDPDAFSIEVPVVLRGMDLYQDGAFTISTAADKSLVFEPGALKAKQAELKSGLVFSGPHYLKIVGPDGATCTDVQITGRVTIKAEGLPNE